MSKQIERPARAIFAGVETKKRELAIRPDAIGLEFDTCDADRDVAIVGGVGVVCIDGPLAYRDRGRWSYWDSYESIMRRFDAALGDERTHAVLLKIDSPGGEVAGLFETCRMMREAADAAGKFVVAYVDEGAYSAAYALACVADEIYMPPSGGVGSVGVITSLCDATKMNDRIGLRIAVITSGDEKADGNPDVELSKDTIKRVQKRVNGLAALFWEQVAAARGMSSEEVGALQAGAFYGPDSVSSKLADDVMSLDDVLTTLANMTDGAASSTSAQGETIMGKTLAAKKAVDEARAKLATAKTTADRRSAQSALDKATKALAVEQRGGARAQTVTVETEDDDDEASDDDAGSDTDAALPDSDSDSSSSDSDSSSSSASSTGGAAASDEASTGLHTKERLLRMCRQITGKTEIAEVMGALDGMAASMKNSAKLAARLDKIEARERGQRVEALLAEGRRDGKITVAQVEYFRNMGMRSTKELRGFLSTAPRVVSRFGHDEIAESSERHDPIVNDQATKLGIDPKAAQAHAKDAKISQGRYVPKPRAATH